MFVALAIVAMRGARWAYALFVGMALLYFPQKGRFTFDPPSCSWDLGGNPIATAATNYSHIVLAGLFYLVTYVHFARRRPNRWSPSAVAALTALVMSALVEVAQGASNTGNCELRDLIPDGLGIMAGMIVVALWRRSTLVPPHEDG